MSKSFKTAKIVFIILLLLSISLASEFDNYKCLIHNVEYPFEYLMAQKENKIDFIDRDIFTAPLRLIKKYEILEWNIISIIDDVTVHLKNIFSDQYLCASNKDFLPLNDLNARLFSKKRRLVNMLEEKEIDVNCEWRLEKIEPKTKDSKKYKGNKYRFWNVYYNQSLYAVSNFLNGRNKLRAVYLWHKKPDSDQFSWFIDCMTGTFLTE